MNFESKCHSVELLLACILILTCNDGIHRKHRYTYLKKYLGNEVHTNGMPDMITRLEPTGFIVLLLVLLRPQLGIQQGTRTDVPRRTPKGLTHLDKIWQTSGSSNLLKSPQIPSEPWSSMQALLSPSFTLMFVDVCFEFQNQLRNVWSETVYIENVRCSICHVQAELAEWWAQTEICMKKESREETRLLCVDCILEILGTGHLSFQVLNG